MSALSFRNIDQLFAAVTSAARTGMTTPALPNRDALRDLFEKHADWHDTQAGSQAFIEVEAAADLAGAWADEQLNPKSNESGCGNCWKCLDADEIAPAGYVLCPTCGNKRCPRASDHALDCTRSNEPGQAGSVYGAMP